MNINIVKKAILSEKAYQGMAKSAYTFLIDTRATKNDVKKSVEELFSVNVQKVNITKLKEKSKRIGKTRKFAQVGGGKKAVVWLEAGQTISMLSPKTESKAKNQKKEKKEKKGDK